MLIDVLRNLFDTVCYSEAGTERRALEEATYMFFIEFLNELECERGNNVLRHINIHVLNRS